MSKNIRIRVNGFDIYLGISKTDKKKRQSLDRAYQNQVQKNELERARFKQEYTMAKLY